MAHCRLRQVGRVGSLRETSGISKCHKTVQLRKIHDAFPSSCYDDYDLCSSSSFKYTSDKRERQVLSCAIHSIGPAPVGGPESEDILMTTLVPNTEFARVASDEDIATVVTALTAKGMDAEVFENRAEARSHVLDLLPEGAE